MTEELIFGIYQDTESGMLEMFANISPENAPLVYLLLDKEKQMILGKMNEGRK